MDYGNQLSIVDGSKISDKMSIKNNSGKNPRRMQSVY